MFSVVINTGRLIELRISGTVELPEMKAFQDRVRAVIASAAGRKVVACCDFRGNSVYTQEVANELIELMRGDNPSVERSAILIAGNAVFAMQMERIVRNAKNPNRQTFRNPAEAVAWLSTVLSIEERVQLQRFMWG